jgi:adenylate kinase
VSSEDYYSPSDFPNIILLGPPGSGKGTQAKLLCKDLWFDHFSTGDVFRRMATEDKEMKARLDAGHLLSDDEVNAVVLKSLHRGRDRRVIDGFPRTVGQAEALQPLLKYGGIGPAVVILLEVPLVELAPRIAGRLSCPKDGSVFHDVMAPPLNRGRCDECGTDLVSRPEDDLTVVKKRLELYAAKTEPLIGYYEKLGMLARVDGSGGKGQQREVYARVMEGYRSKMDPWAQVRDRVRMQKFSTEALYAELKTREAHPSRDRWSWNDWASILYLKGSGTKETSWGVRSVHNRCGRNEGHNPDADPRDGPVDFANGPWELMEMNSDGYRVDDPNGVVYHSFDEAQAVLEARWPLGSSKPKAE